MQQLEVAGTVFSGKAPGPAMYERVSRALSELGYERTPSQCRERMKVQSTNNIMRLRFSTFATLFIHCANTELDCYLTTLMYEQNNEMSSLAGVRIV